MPISNELQKGVAGEYLVCADLIMKGLVAYTTEQGLPYDVVIDVEGKLLKCQVKTTEKPREIPQRSKKTYVYIFNIKRHGKKNIKRYEDSDVDVFALVELNTRTVAYLKNTEMPDTINLRVDALRDTYYDEKGKQDYEKVHELLLDGLNQTEIADELDIAVATVNRMCNENYKPFMTKAKYFSDLYKNKDWFYEI